MLVYARDNAVAAPTDAQLGAAVVALRMLADETRLCLMWHLSRENHDVGTLARLSGAARPSVSQHLAKLRLAGLVHAERIGRRVVYTVAGGHVRRLVDEALMAADHQVSGLPPHD